MLLSSRPPGFSLEGYHVARCFALIELGTIHVVDKWQGQVRLSWEMPEDLRDYYATGVPVPKQFSRQYNSSLYGKSNLKRHLSSWFGEQTVNVLDTKFDPHVIVGSACKIKIEHKRNPRTNAWFEEITDVIPCDQACPPLHNPIKVLTFEDFDWDLFNSLPDFLAQKIMSSKEFPSLEKNMSKSNG